MKKIPAIKQKCNCRNCIKIRNGDIGDWFLKCIKKK